MEKTIKKYLFEYQFNELSLDYPRYYQVRDFYVGKTDPLFYQEFNILNRDTQFIGFTLPEHIRSSEYLVYIDGAIIDEEIIYRRKDRIYIKYPDLDGFLNAEIEILWFPNSSVVDIELNENWENYVELNLNNNSFYMKGNFLEFKGLEQFDSFVDITSTYIENENDYYYDVNGTKIELNPENDLMIKKLKNGDVMVYSPNYIISTTALIIVSNQLDVMNFPRINAHCIRIPNEYSNLTNVFFSIDKNNSTYYTETLKEMFLLDDFTIPDRNYFEEIYDVIENEDYNDLDPIKNNDMGMYYELEKEIYGKNNDTFNIEDLDVVYQDDESHNFYKNTKLNFYKPKFKISLLNKNLDYPEIFINNKLYYDERTVVREGDYVHIYIGVEKLFKDIVSFKDLYLDIYEGNIDEIKSKVSNLISDSNIKITINFQPSDYTFENFAIPNNKFNHIYLPENYQDIHNKKLYLNGILLNEDDYEFSLSPRNEEPILFFKQDLPDDSIFTLTGFTELKRYNKINISFSNILSGENGYYGNDIYYNGNYLGRYTEQKSIYDRVLNVDDTQNINELTLYKSQNIPTSSYDYNLELLSANNINYEPVLNTDLINYNHNIMDEKTYQLIKYFIELVDTGLVGTSDVEDSGIIDIIKERYPLILSDNDTVDIDPTELNLPKDFKFPDKSTYIMNDKFKLLMGRFNDVTIPDYIDEEINKRGVINIDSETLKFIDPKEFLLERDYM